MAVFHINGQLLAAGDELAAEYGLSSTRWQVLGAIVYEQQPLTVPQIARHMGLTRQAVHASVRRLVADGLLEFVANVHHRRSKLVQLTPEGRRIYDAIDRKQAVWINQLGAGLTTARLETAAGVLAELSARLDASPET